MESAQPPAPFRQAGVPPRRLVPGLAGPPPPAHRVRRLRLVLSVIGGMLALLCIGGAGIAYVAYDTVTQPDRSAPDVVVDNYLRAVFLDRDETRATLFVCNDSSKLTPIQELKGELSRREQRFATRINVSWGSLDPHVQGDTANVGVELRISAVVDGFEQTDLQRWQFGLTRSDSWRLCVAAQMA